MAERISKQEYYLEIARAVAQRSPCIRRQFGAIIVKNDAIISTGYNGPARGVVNCLEVGCLKNELNLPHYSGYEFCTGVHAEENSIINAARNGSSTIGGTLYIFGQNFGDKSIVEAKPCDRCKRAIINAGIEKVIIKKSDGSIQVFEVKEWVSEDTENYLKKLKEARMKL
ncbi:MAG: dCMP deaminase family protein [Candidatus Aenigmatarchaeota archaeon]